MPQQVRKVTEMVIDEISLVDRPANQHAHIVLAKRDSQEDDVPDYFDAEGAKVDIDALTPGDVVFDENDQAFEYYIEGEDDVDAAKELETAGVSKSAFGAPVAPGISPTLESLRAELSKAITEGDQAEVISKALGEIAKFEQRTVAAESIAKSERDLRLNREYIAKAGEYNLPIKAEELGPVLKSMWEAESEHGALPAGSCAVIHKALATAGQILFTELGYEGQTAETEAADQVDAYIDEEIAKAVKAGNDAVSKSAATEHYYRSNPRAYDEYLAGLGR